MCNEEHRLERHGLITNGLVASAQADLEISVICTQPGPHPDCNRVLHGTVTESCLLVQDAGAVGGQWAGPIAALSQ